MNKMPFFSIVTVTLNHLSGLQRTYESIFQQNCEDFEWIVIDGASKDGTPEFLETLDFDNVRWISEPDTGLYDAMNKGIAIARGTYILFLNAGDTFAGAGVLQKTREYAEEENLPDFIYGDAWEMIDNHLYLKKAYSHKMIWYGMFTHHQAMFYKRKTLNNIRYRARYTLAADFALTSEFFSCKDISVCRLSMPVCIFEGGGATSTINAHMRGIREQWDICHFIQKSSKVICTLISVLHLGKHAVLHLLRPLYILLRYHLIRGDYYE